jgi:hypothetical protein
MNSTELNETSVVDSAAPVVDSAATGVDAVADVENVAVAMPVASDDSAAVAAAVAVAVAVDDADTSEEEDDVLALPVYIDDEEPAMSPVAILHWTKYYKNDDDMKLLRKYILDKYLHTTDKALKEIRQSTAETLAVIMFKLHKCCFGVKLHDKEGLRRRHVNQWAAQQVSQIVT